MRNVLISGASIAGPALAYWLNRADIRTTVIERAPAPRPGGQAIDVRGPALTVLDQMGLLDQARGMRTQFKGMSTLDINGQEVERHEDRTVSGGRFNSGDIELLRDDLAGLLLGSSKPAEYIFNDMITSLKQDDTQVFVTFQHHPPRHFDLVIGADGLHSNVRQLVFGDERGFLVPLGIGLAVYTTPNLLGLQDWELAYRDETSGYVIYPARDNTELRVNLGFGMDLDEYRRGDLEAQKALVAERCAHLGGDIPRLLDVLRGAQEFYFGPLAQVRMDSWSKGRVTLAGDAAHCPSPFSGQGTSLALVGAFVLGRELARSGDNFSEAFLRYEKRMRPFVLLNQDMVSVERQGPIPDDIFERAKNGISLEDLLS